MFHSEELRTIGPHNLNNLEFDTLRHRNTKLQIRRKHF